MMQFGFRAHDFGRMTIERLSQTLHVFAPVAIQLALKKALVGAPEAGASLSPGYARRIRNVLAAHDIDIAVLGCYINPVHPDDAELEHSLWLFEEHLAFSGEFGCALVGTETGSVNPDGSFHPETGSQKTFDRLCRSIERLVRTAERFGATVGIEPVAGQHTIDSPEAMLRLLGRIDSPNLRVIYDPVNLLPWEAPPAFDDAFQRTFFRTAFEAFADRISAIHLKDVRYVDGRKVGNLPPLTGVLDTMELLRLINERKPGIDILLENSQPETAALTLGALHRMAGQLL